MSHKIDDIFRASIRFYLVTQLEGVVAQSFSLDQLWYNLFPKEIESWGSDEFWIPQDSHNKRLSSESAFDSRKKLHKNLDLNSSGLLVSDTAPLPEASAKCQEAHQLCNGEWYRAVNETRFLWSHVDPIGILEYILVVLSKSDYCIC